MGGKSSKDASSLSPQPPGAKVLRSPLFDRRRRKDEAQVPAAKPRVLFEDDNDDRHERTPPGLLLANICTASSTRRAEELKQLEERDIAAKGGDGLSRFAKYRNFFKNHETELATEVQRMVSRANKRELRAWVSENVGDFEQLEAYTKLELVELAMVSAAIARHGEKALAAKDKCGELAKLPNTALHTHDLRMPSKQQACRAQSKAARKQEMQAAHYVGLEVAMTLNSRLPVTARVGDELREILNDPSNLRLVLAATNQKLHKTADNLLMVDYEQWGRQQASQAGQNNAKKKRKAPRNKPTPQEYARLVQVAKHAQSNDFQAAMRACDGLELYRSLRDQFLRLDVGDRAPVWDVTKDTIVSSKGAASKVVMMVEEAATGRAKARSTPSRSPSPAVDAPKPATQPTTTEEPEKLSKKAVVKVKKALKKPHHLLDKIAKAVKTVTPSEKEEKEERHERKAAKPKAAKQPKENRGSASNAATVAASAKPSKRRVTRSKGAAKHVALPETFSDSSEYVDSDEDE